MFENDPLRAAWLVEVYTEIGSLVTQNNMIGLEREQLQGRAGRQGGKKGVNLGKIYLSSLANVGNTCAMILK